MIRRTIIAGVAIATAAGLVSSSLFAAGPAGAKERRLDRFAGHHTISLKDLKHTPLALQADRTVTVMIKVAGPSVTTAAGSTGSTTLPAPLTSARKNTVRTEGLAAQTAVVAAVRARGGKVLARLADAVNVVVAKVPASSLAELARVPGVLSVQPSRVVSRTNTRSNLYTGAQQAWQSYGVTGRGVKIAIIDDGIDYTHADFGGRGTAAAYDAIDPTKVARGVFPTAKVIDGYDFVGDGYDAIGENGSPTPVPDRNPLACGEHGTHVAGTAAGFGVTTAGRTYRGGYSAKAMKVSRLRIGPGSAPDAKLMAYKVFGCQGSVDDFVIVYALDRAVRDGANVINMSLGSPYGSATSIESEAIDNATNTGVVVVVAAGNDGPAPYIVAGPSTAPTALSVAAMDAIPTFPGAKIGTISAINANAARLPVTGVVAVVRDDAGVSLGCDPYTDAQQAQVVGKIAVIQRGTCARVDKAKNAEAAGAKAVVMINNDNGYPPFEGVVPDLTIPFLGVPSGQAAALTVLDTTTVTITAATLANPEFAKPSDFTSGGPRSGDGGLKPEVSAPGVSLVSASVGTGSGSLTVSGTSMAAPHTTGVVALVRQAHPRWTARAIKAVIVNTASRGTRTVAGEVRVVGSGLVRPSGAIRSELALVAPGGAGGLAFGVVQPSGAYDASRRLQLVNRGRTAVRVALSATATGAAHGALWTVTPRSVVVRPGSVFVTARLRLSAASVAGLPAAGGVSILSGQIVATPARGVKLRVPAQVVAYGRSNVTATSASSALSLANTGLRSGDADVYEWLGTSPRAVGADVDLRALGYQSFDGAAVGAPGDRLLVFAINQHNRFSNPAANEYDIIYDVDGDSKPDVVTVVIDGGLLLNNTPDGSLVSATFDLATGDGVVLNAYAPVDGSIVEVPVLASSVGLTSTAPTAGVAVEAASWITGGQSDAIGGPLAINAWDQQRSTAYESVPVGGAVTVPVTSRALATGEVATPGWMVVTVDDRSGSAQADLVAAPPAP